MKRRSYKIRLAFIFLSIFCSTLLIAKNAYATGQYFYIFLPPPDQGNIAVSGSAGPIAIPNSRVIEVAVGETVLFYSTGKDGYEPAGFRVNGQPHGSNSFFTYTVTPGSLGPPIPVEALFNPAHDAVAAHVKILSPAQGSVTIIGANATVSISGTVDDISPNVVEIYKNDMYLSQTIINTKGSWLFLNLPLGIGDNVFMVKTTDSAGNVGIDMLLVHYAPQPVDNVRAAVLIDRRLYQQTGISAKLNEYITASQNWLGEGYKIFLDVVDSIDGWNTDEVRNRVVRLKNEHPFLEGILFIGNIKLPSFYAPRPDALQSRLITHKYEDLDIILRKDIYTVQADYDYMAKGPNPYPELWNAYIPVGFNGGAPDNEYQYFATQILEFLNKVIAQRNGLQVYKGLYFVANGLNDLGGITNEYGPMGVDFYGVNDTGYGPYHFTYPQPDVNLFYKRTRIEEFGSYATFSRYYYRFPWMGEGWQRDYIFTNYLQNAHYAMVFTCVHSWEQWSLLSTDQAKALAHGGLILIAEGCSVAGFKQYGARSYVDTDTLPDRNILCAFVYGNSDFLAALGDPFNRANGSESDCLETFVAQRDYLGLAHFFRKCYQYHRSGSDPNGLKEKTQEMLIGDPFVVFYALAAPSNLVANAVSSTQINLTWRDNSNNETGFKIERRLGSETTFKQIATVPSNTTFYSNTGLIPGKTYVYRVRAYNSAGDSAYSNTAQTTTPVPPLAPSNLVANAVSSTQINLTWRDNSTNEDGFRIERRLSSELTFRQIATVSKNIVSYNDAGLIPGKTYIYRIRAYNSGGASSYSNTAQATTAIPLIPSNLVATAISSSQINLIWKDNSDNEIGFKIERRLGSETTFKQIATVPRNVTSYSNVGLARGTTYYYRVRAYNNLGNSTYSNTASATTKY